MRTAWSERLALPVKLGVLGKVRIHPLLIALIVVAVGVGLWRDVVVLFLLVMLHELGHAVTADWLGYEVEEVSLLPFGGVARISYGNIGFVPRHEALIAIAGPLVNFLLIAAAAGMHFAGLWDATFFHLVVRLNLWIALFNLLPAMPLDGGRILRAAQSRSLGFEAATVEAYKLGIGLAALMFALGGLALWAGYAHVGLLVLGFFLLYSAFLGIRGMRMETVRFLDAKRRRAQGIDAVRIFAVSRDATVRDVVRRFGPDRYYLVYVLDEQGNICDEVEEPELLEAVFQGNWFARLDALHQSDR